jgi:hypothetical protein
VTDRELDALVAEKVMGWTYYPLAGRWAVPNSRPESNTVANPDFPRYSADIAAAWEVVEKLGNEGCYIGASIQLSPNGRAGCSFHSPDTGDHAMIWNDSAPRAICLAALKAVGVKVPAAQPAQKQGEPKP